MKGLIARRGRLAHPVLVTVAALALTVSVMVGVAWGASPSTTLTSETAQGDSLTVNASDLGEFNAERPTIKSPSAIVINMTTGKVLYQHNAEAVRPMASTTKIMTAILVLESMKLDQQVVVSQNAVNTPEPVPFLKVGDTYTVEQLLYAMMLRSANSAAVALAEACSGTVEAFVELMNKKALDVGMAHTSFITPNGLDKNGHASTAADMATLARYAMQNEEFRKIVSTRKYLLPMPGRGTLTCKNTNTLLQNYDWVTGIKTGLTPKADQCLVASGTKDGVNIISVILGQPSTKVCFSESKALLLYGFSQCKAVTLLQKGAVVAEAQVPYKLDGRLQLITAGDVSVELYKSESVTASVVVDKALQLPVKAGDAFGEVKLTVDGKPVGEVPLVAAQSFDRPSLGGKVAYYWHRLGRALGRMF